jgi:DNA invertase Pin-like site-specific DNA recombinase
LASRNLQFNGLLVKDLGQSGQNPSFLVATRWEGGRPGQIRDKFGSFSRCDNLTDWPQRREEHWALPLADRRRRWAARPKGSRKPTAASERRRLLLEQVNREIDQLVVDFHALLPRSEAKQTGGIYARYSTEFQHSVLDQVRSLLEYAVREGIFVPRDCIFIDLSEKGGKERRPGLLLLREALAARRFQILLVFSTNRLYRKAYKSLRLVEEDIVEKGLRCIFVKSAIDTADKDRWRMLLQLLAMMDEAYSSFFRENIRAAHLGLAAKGLVYSTIPFGYKGEPIEGQFTKRKKPRCLLAIDDVATTYVRQVFEWFTNQVVPMDEIVRRLNADPDAPLPPKATEGAWTHKAVVGVLRNPRYCGLWPCCETETRWLSGPDYARQFKRDEPLGVFIHEKLRIIPDELWCRTQARLDKVNRRRGRKPGTSKSKPPSSLLNGLFVCPTHDRTLYVGGANGSKLFCKGCRQLAADQRPLFTLLDYQLAAELTVQTVRDLLLGDEDLAARVVDACQAAARSFQEPDPAVTAELKSRDQKLGRSIEMALRDPGESPEEQLETMRLVKTLRQERSQVRADLAVRQTTENRPIQIPVVEEVREQLVRFNDALLAASQSCSAEEQGLAREIIDLVTGGSIELAQMGECRPRRGWLQGSFTCDLVGVVASKVSGQTLDQSQVPQLVVIDYRKVCNLDVQADRAKSLYDQGLLEKDIATELRCSRSRVTRLLHHWFESRGLKMPDGRARRSTLAVKHTDPPPFQRLSEPVMELIRQNWHLGDIAVKLKCDRNTVTKAIQFWHQSRGLPVPDGRTRRKTLPRRTRRKAPPSAGSPES